MATVTLKDLMSPLSKIEAYANETSETVKRIEEFLVQGMNSKKSSNMSDKYFEKLCDILTSGLNAKEISNSIAEQTASLNEQQLNALVDIFNVNKSINDRASLVASLNEQQLNALVDIFNVSKSINDRASLISSLGEQQLNVLVDIFNANKKIKDSNSLSEHQLNVLEDIFKVNKSIDDRTSLIASLNEQQLAVLNLVSNQLSTNAASVAEQQLKALGKISNQQTLQTEAVYRTADNTGIWIGSALRQHLLGLAQTNEKLDALIEISTGASDGGGSMAIMGELQKQTLLLQSIAGTNEEIDKQTGKSVFQFLAQVFTLRKILKTIKDGAKSIAGGEKQAEKDKNAEENSALLKTLGVGSIKTALGMTLWSIVPKKGVTKFVDFIERTYAKLAEQDNKKVKEGIDNLAAMGGAIFKFAKSLALAAPLLIIGAIGIPILYLTTILVTPLFLLLGMAEKQIKGGAEAMADMGMGLVKFAAGLALFALVSYFVMQGGLPLMMTMAGSIILIGGAVALLGLVDKQVKKGSVALGMMGIGLAVFGIGYAAYAGLISLVKPTLGDIALQAGILVGLGIATALLGFAFSYIGMGALAMIAMGVGLFVFGLGYIPFANATKDTTMEDVGVQGALLLMLGLEFAAAGVGALLIGAGALAFGAVGLALQELAPGLAAIKKVDFTEKDALKLTTTLAGVKAAFVGPPSKGGVSGFFSSIGGAITGAIDAGGMTAAAIGFAAAGKALTKLSVGLKDYQKLDWTNEQSLQLAGVLSGISTAFAQAGGEAATPTGLFGAVFGNAFSPNATKKGIDSVMGAGKALTSIATGLIEFQKLAKSKISFVELSEDIGKVIGFVSEAFAAIGGEDQEVESGGFFSSLFGIKSTSTEEGIRSVKDAGSALTGIAKGLEAFQGLKDPATTASKIGEVIGFVSEAFAAIGEKDQKVESGGFFSSLFGIKSTATEEGIRSVKGAGDELVKIGTALEKFQGLKDPKGTASKIEEALGFVQLAFAAIGSEEKVESGGFFSSLFGIKSTATEEGIRSVKGAGDELVKIGTALEKFSGLKDPKATATNIKQVLGMVGSAFASIGGNEESGDDSWLFSWDENLVQKGIEAVDGAGSALTDIAEGLQTFADLENPAGIAQGIETIFTSIGDTFAKYYNDTSFRTDLDHMQGFITELSTYAQDGSLAKAATDIQSISNAVNSIDSMKAESFANLFKGAGELSNNDKAYEQLAKAVEEIRDIMSDQGSSIGDAVGGAISNAFGGGGDGGDDKKKESGGMNRTLKAMNSTMGKLESTMSRLPSQIQQITIEVSD